MVFVGDHQLTELGFVQTAEDKTDSALLNKMCGSLKHKLHVHENYCRDVLNLSFLN